MLTDGDFGDLYDWLARYRTLVVAVSGGCDSMALCATLARWRDIRDEGAPVLKAVTIDHGLRPGSGAEAAQTGALTRLLGVDHTIIAWTGVKPGSAIQATARRMRYRLLAEVARCQAQPAAIVTAHHADDQAETVLMRLARGSGLDGLAGIARERLEDGVPVVRPLLTVSKADLAATLVARGLRWIEDPSNQNIAFERVRLRKQSASLAAAGLTAPMLATSARRLARARDALQAATVALARRTLDEHEGAFASIDLAGWLEAPEEIRIRLLSYCLERMGGQEQQPELARIEALADRLGQNDVRGASLGGCLVDVRSGVIAVFREPGRKGLPVVEVAPGEARLWDRRFEVACGAAVGEPVEVRPLGAEVYASLRTALASPVLMPARAARTLPSFWHGDALLAVPHLGYEQADATPRPGFAVRFAPQRPAR